MCTAQKVVAFVSFSTQDQALKAKEDLNGLQYDPENPHTILRIELAKSNTRSKRPHEPLAEYEKKQPRYDRPDMYGRPGVPPPPTAPYPYGDPYAASAAATAMPGMPPGIPPSMPGMPGMPGMPQAPPMGAPLAQPQRPSPAPCNTIFVSNLTTSVTEDHLRSLFANLGQKRVRLLPKGNTLVAFIEVGCSSSAASCLVFSRLPHPLLPFRVAKERKERGERGRKAGKMQKQGLRTGTLFLTHRSFLLPPFPPSPCMVLS